MNPTISVKCFTVAWPDSGSRIWVFLYNVNTQEPFQETKNIGHSLLKKHSKFQSFDEIFCCGMSKFRTTNLDVFIQRQYTRTILRKKNVGQNLFRKHSKLLNFDEMFYCVMTRLRNTIWKYCSLCGYVEAIKPKKVVVFLRII